MKIYTKSGDQGETEILNKRRVSKDDKHIEAIGAIDEANAQIGFAVCCLKQEHHSKYNPLIHTLTKIQENLFQVGIEILNGDDSVWESGDELIYQLEQEIDELEKQLPVLRQFILPGGHQAACTLQIARTVVRRAERAAVSVKNNHPVTPYLNRLSDYLFVAARFVNLQVGIADELLTK